MAELNSCFVKEIVWPSKPKIFALWSFDSKSFLTTELREEEPQPRKL